MREKTISNSIGKKIYRTRKLSNPNKKIGGRQRSRTTENSYMRRNPESILAYETLYANIMKNKRKKRLQHHKWGFGLEHETHLFHINYSYYDNDNKNLKAFELFDSESVVNRILKADFNGKIKLNQEDKELIQSKIPFEKTGRKCNGVQVLKKAPYLMPEFITTNPFSSLKTGVKPIYEYKDELRTLQDRFLNILYDNDARTNTQCDKKGYIGSFPFGMSNYVLFGGKPNPEYTGSYHITMTLPYTDKTTTKAFREMHINFANQMQWLEPLLLTAFFSCDDKAVGTTEKRARGSFRVLRVAWGNFAGSNVQNFKKGIGRYANVNTFWRDGFNFHEKDKLKPCIKPSPSAIKEGGITTLSSDFRTFGPDPNNPAERISGASMDKPNGMEFRIFDDFKVDDLPRLLDLMIHIAENSIHHTTKKFVNKNTSWINATQKIMLNGWRTILDEDYINELRTALNLKINTESRLAFNVLSVINKEVYNKNRNGDIPFLLNNGRKPYKTAMKMPTINRRSWDNGFMIKLNNNKGLMIKYNKFILDLKKIGNKKIKRNDALDIFYKYFNKTIWGHNFDDVLYFMEFWYNSVKIHKSKIGNIIGISVISKKISKLTNFNNNIIIQFLLNVEDTIDDIKADLYTGEFIRMIKNNKYILFKTFVNMWNKHYKNTDKYNKYMDYITENQEKFDIIYKDKKIYKIKFIG